MLTGKNFTFLILFLFGAFFQINAQSPKGSDPWKTLQNVEWKHFFDEALGFDVSQPVFGENIRKLEGFEITIKGYIIPVDTDGNYMVLSSLPFNNCFFCGNAGPETVMEIDLNKDKSLINKYVTLRGTLELNDHDYLSLIYKLRNVELVDVEN